MCVRAYSNVIHLILWPKKINSKSDIWQQKPWEFKTRELMNVLIPIVCHGPWLPAKVHRIRPAFNLIILDHCKKNCWWWKKKTSWQQNATYCLILESLNNDRNYMFVIMDGLDKVTLKLWFCQTYNDTKQAWIKCFYFTLTLFFLLIFILSLIYTLLSLFVWSKNSPITNPAIWMPQKWYIRNTQK